MATNTQYLQLKAIPFGDKMDRLIKYFLPIILIAFHCACVGVIHWNAVSALTGGKVPAQDVDLGKEADVVGGRVGPPGHFVAALAGAEAALVAVRA